MDKQTKRPYSKIQYSNETRRANISKKRGTQQQTTSLNLNLKTVSKGYLLEYLSTTNNETTSQIINQYINDKGNFTSTRKLFGSEQEVQSSEQHQSIRKYMLKVYQSPEFIKKIFQNEKMDYRTKLLFLKFIQKIRMAAIKPTQHKLWKQRI